MPHPVFNPAVYQQRRARLAANLPLNSLLLVGANAELTRSRDTEFSFRQHSDMLYLTGFAEPESYLLLSKDQQGVVSELLLCRDKDPLAEVWQGRRFGPSQAQSSFGIAAQSQTELASVLLQQLNGKSILVYAQGEQAELDQLVAETLTTLRLYPKRGYKAPLQQHDLRPLIASLRLYKDEHEVALMQQAGFISAQAHIKAMQLCRPGMFEYQLEAIIKHHCAMQGAREMAYNTIVGGGENGCILHYTDNDAPLQAGDLVLIDAGCELGGYAADITRTFPVSGKFSAEQAAVYQVVLNAQYAACAAVKPGNSSKDTIAAALAALTEGLLALGILQGDLDELIAKQAAKQYFIHGLGHWLGLDVHDVGTYKTTNPDGVEADIAFAPGMVLTIEPGLYIPTGSPCDAKWWGLAVRIEDDLLVIKDGHLNLTDTVPKEIAAIEALMAAAS